MSWGYCNFGEKPLSPRESFTIARKPLRWRVKKRLDQRPLACQTGFKEVALNFHVWQSQIPLDYLDRKFLLNGIKNGLDIVDSEKIITPVDIANYISATGADMVALVKD